MKVKGSNVNSKIIKKIKEGKWYLKEIKREMQ
jgi:hypothetical protein